MRWTRRASSNQSKHHKRRKKAQLSGGLTFIKCLRSCWARNASQNPSPSSSFSGLPRHPTDLCNCYANHIKSSLDASSITSILLFAKKSRCLIQLIIKTASWVYLVPLLSSWIIVGAKASIRGGRESEGRKRLDLKHNGKWKLLLIELSDKKMSSVDQICAWPRLMCSLSFGPFVSFAFNLR